MAFLNLQEHTKKVAAMQWAPGNPGTGLLATAGDDATIKLWDTETGRARETLRYHGSAVNAIAFSPDGEYLASYGQDCTVHIHSVRTHNAIKVLTLPSSQYFDVAWSYDSQLLAATYSDSVLLFDIRYV